jgi:hypothetical protein
MKDKPKKRDYAKTWFPFDMSIIEDHKTILVYH